MPLRGNQGKYWQASLRGANRCQFHALTRGSFARQRLQKPSHFCLCGELLPAFGQAGRFIAHRRIGKACFDGWVVWQRCQLLAGCNGLADCGAGRRCAGAGLRSGAYRRRCRCAIPHGQLNIGTGSQKAGHGHSREPEHTASPLCGRIYSMNGHGCGG